MSTIATTRKRKQAVDSLEHRVERLYTIAVNFDQRFIAIETALALMTAPAVKPTRSRKPSQKSVAASD